jgi:heavy metal sensor kinase
MLESLRARLLVLYAMVVIAVVAAFGASVCYAYWRSLVGHLDADLRGRATTLSRALRPAEGGAFDLDLPEDTVQYFQEAGAGAWYGIWDAKGAQIYVSDPDAAGSPHAAPGVATRNGRRELVLAGPAGTLILVSRDLAELQDAVRSLGLTAAGVGALAALLSLAFGWFLAGRALAPIARINETARAMAEGDLSARIPIDRTETELGQVALALNTAFDRLEAALERQRRFTADASHELRTPLATLTVESDWALARERTPSDYRDSLAICRKATQRMRGVVEQLLTLARADADDLPVEKSPVRLDEVLDDVVGLIRPQAERRNIGLVALIPPLEVVGDAARLREAFSNLVTNAVQYNRDNGKVDVSAAFERGTAIISVEDTGKGISAEDLPHVFERFYRGDRTRASDGSVGLGLAVAKAIIERHGGQIRCSSEPERGTTFEVRLPAREVAAEHARPRRHAQAG